MNPILNYILLFLAGGLLCNGIPHLTAGLRGEPFPTPFAKPPGVGLSAPVTNVLWGSLNLFAGVALTAWRFAFVDVATALALMAVGWLALGIPLSRHFGTVRARRER